MSEQRERSRAWSSSTHAGDELREQALALVGQAGFQTDFKGYETTDLETTIGAVHRDGGQMVLAKLVESPFYPTGGRQIADARYVERADRDCRASVEDGLRNGDDQVVGLAGGRGPRG